MVEVTCQGCGREFEAQRKTAKYCDATCRKRGNRRESVGSTAPGTPVEQEGDNPADRVGLVEAYRAALAAAGRVDTPHGQLVLVLAARVMSPFDTGSSIASVAKQLDAAFDRAMQGAASGDAVDEFTERLRRKQAAARAG